MPALRSYELDDFEPLITMPVVERGSESAPIVRALRRRSCWICGPVNVIAAGGLVLNRRNDPTGARRTATWPLLNRTGHDPGDEDRT